MCVLIPASFMFVLALAACTRESAVAPSRAAPSSVSRPAVRPALAPLVTVEVPDALRQAVAAVDRSADDRALDEARRPAELLAFAAVREGSRVGEVGAWKGYTAELLSRAVGPSGHVYAEDPPAFSQWIQEAWDERSKRREFTERLTHLVRPFEDPFGPEIHGLAAVFSVMFYHDTVWLGVDRARMNAAIFAALAPGGEYVVVDHSARAGDGATVTKTLHRIEESVVVAELTAAGFVLSARADFLRHGEDLRDWNAGDEGPPAKRGRSDRFVLKFVRPLT